MTNLEIISESFRGLLAQACLSALLLIIGLYFANKIFKFSRSSLSQLWRKSRMCFASMALLAVAMGLWADKTNLLRQIIHPWNFGDPPVVTVCETDILRGFRLEGIVTNDEPLCDMPVDAVEYAPWRLRGGRENWFPLDFGDFVFPHGTNRINRLRVLSGGMVETFPKLSAPASICAAREYASLIPGVSRFWSADAASGAEKVLRWDSVFANRDRTGEYSAEIRLCANGDFSTRSNEVESVFRRVNPHDWDGDGLANEIDANPTAYDGDFFGPANVLPEGANTNAYCIVSLVVSGADALVSFVGDKPSNYPDPQFVARHGVTNNVLILIGKTYDIISDQPFVVVGASDPETETTISDGAVRVVRPVEIECTQESSTGFSMLVNPSNLGGAFSWEQDCCQITSNATSGPLAFSFVGNQECLCLGCQASGGYWYEGYSVLAHGGMCPCYHVGDEPNWGTTSGPAAPSVSAAFTTSAVIYEETYENMPGEWMPKRSTRTRLNVGAIGGPYGGTLTVDTTNISKLSKLSGPILPATSVSVPAESTVSYSIVYDANEYSATTNDISVVATFAENLSGEVHCSTTSLTSVRVELRAFYEAPENPCTNRHVYGVCEKVKLMQMPSDADVQWFNGTFGLQTQDGGNNVRIATLPFLKGMFRGLVAKVGIGDGYSPSVTIVEPSGIRCTNASWSGVTTNKNIAGMVEMDLALQILPRSVSFRNIDVSEKPCDRGWHTEYFNCLDGSGFETHTVTAGAGRWQHIGEGNYFMTDSPRCGYRPPPWLANSMLVWEIPHCWWPSKEDGTLMYNGFVPSEELLEFGLDCRQISTLDEHGTVTLEKHGHVIMRTTNDWIRLDGVTVHGGE